MSDPTASVETETTEPAEEAIIVIVSEDGSGEVAVDRHLLQQILGSTDTEMLNLGTVPENEATEDRPAEEAAAADEETVNEPGEDFSTAEPMDILEDEEKMQVEPIGPMSEQINSLLTLDEEEIKKIEHALQSQEADEILSDTFQSILEPEAELDDLLDPELTAVAGHEPMDEDGRVPHVPLSLDEENSGLDTDSSSTAATQTSGRSVSPKRRSQRQIDRQEREQLEKIRAENEQMLKKEKETMSKKEDDKLEKPEVQTDEKPVSRLTAIRQEMQQKILAVEPLKKPQTTLSKGKIPAANEGISPEAARPKRERKVPKHLREAFEEFEGTPEYLRKLMNSTPVQERSDSYGEAGTQPKKNHEEARVKGSNSVNKETKTKDESDNGKPEETAGDRDGENEEDDDDDGHSGESWNSDDDPDKLWCICRKPHNNRFMICCDKCEDWFHGHCVGVTRSMGRQMEENGLEWICPRCVRQEARGGKESSPEEKIDSAQEKSKSPPRKTDSPQVKKPELKVEIVKAKAQLEKRKERSASQGEEAGRKCVIASCRNMARASSIYCSDLCIIAHARDSLALISKEKAKHEKPEAAVAPPTPKNEPIKLKESAAFSKLMSQVTPSPTRSKAIVTGHKPANVPDDYHVTVTDRKTGKILRDSLAPKAADLEAWLKRNPTYEVVKPGISPGMFYRPTQRHSVPSTPTTPSAPANVQQRKRMKSAEVKEEKNLPDPEVMRNSARSSLKEALWNRCKELPESKLTEEDVAKVTEEIESALYRHFNKDVGTKYKAKYRSLLFNIKDVKNQGLFRKIAERQIKPRDLVKMTAEELASKELAEWREREAKHQLDIIKKTELELVTMSKKYNVVKTHKGEEIIEEVGDSKADEKDIVVEPVMEILQGSSKPDHEKESKEKKDKHREKDKHKQKDKDRHRRESSSSKHRKKDKERDRDKRHDKEKDRDKDRSKEKDKSKEENGKKEKERERRHSHKHKEPEKPKKEEEEIKKEDLVKEETKIEIKEEIQPEKTEEPPKKDEKKDEEEKGVKKENVVEEQEPTSTVNIKTPEIESSPVTQIPVWKGVLNSSDVGKFSVHAYELSSSADLSETFTKDTLDIVGRIPPQMVWDYIMQTRKVGTREVVAIHLQPQMDSDRKFYNAFLSHMYKTNRYAVVGPVSKLVKDFYIVPLPKDSPIPTGLTALVPDSPVLDENRTSVLIGLIVRSKKGPVAEVREKHHKPVKKSPVTQATNKTEDAIAYIPTSKSTTKRRPHNEARASAKKAKIDEDDDIPYSPSQLLDDNDDESKLDQQQAILEELNHKIEQQKNELISMTSKMSPQEVETLIPGLEPVIPGLEPTASVSHVPESSSTGLTSISIPNNLQEILSAIQKKEEELTRLSQMVEHSTGDVDLRNLPPLPSGDIDMRKLINPPVQQDNHNAARRDPRRKSLNQLTDEELLAKAMEMESSMNVQTPVVQEPPHVPAAYFPGPPQMMGPGPMHPMGPMMGPRPLPYGPGFAPPRGGPPFGQPGPYWGPMHPRGPRPR